MEALDRYLEAVRKHLPWQRQDDIIAELRANLEAQIEDKEAMLGRRLGKDEADAWLKEFGAPMQVAARYRPQRSLIGPALFPAYRFVLKLVAFWLVVIYSIVNAVQFAVGPVGPAVVVHAVFQLFVILLTIAAEITLVFAAVEYAGTHWPGRFPWLAKAVAEWPGVNLPAPSLPPQEAPGQRSFARAVAEVILGALCLLWLLLIPYYPYLLLGPGEVYLKALPYQLAPIWMRFYWCIVALNLLQLGWRSLDLIRGSWRQPHPVRHILFKVVGLIPLLLVLNAPGHLLVILKQGARAPAMNGVTLAAINPAIHKALLVVAVIVAITLLWEIVLAGLSRYRLRAAAMR